MKFIVTLYPVGADEVRQEIDVAGPLVVVSARGPRPEQHIKGAHVMVMPAGIPYSIVSQVEEEVPAKSYTGYLSPAEFACLERYASPPGTSASPLQLSASLAKKGLLTYHRDGYTISDKGRQVLAKRSV